MDADRPDRPAVVWRRRALLKRAAPVALGTGALLAAIAALLRATDRKWPAPAWSLTRTREPPEPGAGPTTVERNVVVCRGFSGEAITACLNEAGPSAEVFLPAGTYRLSQTIVVPHDEMTIRGAGDGTVLQATDNTFNLMHLPGRRGVTITDLRIRGAGADGRGGQGLTGFRVQGCTFQRLRIERCGSSDASGLFLHASRENRILDCHFEDNGRGLMLYQDSTHNVIERCTGHRNAKEMIFLTEGCADNTISGCVSDHDGSRAPAVAVAIHKSDRTTLLGCTIRRSGQEQGVEIAAGDDNVVADCIITESNWAGLHVVNAQRTVIAGNTIAGNRESGILLRSAGPPDEARPCNHCLIVDNLIADNNPSGRTLPERSWAGIEIQHGSFIRIERNRLRNNRSIGIYIAPGNTGTRISGNVIEGAHAALLVDHGAGTVSDLRPPG